VAGRRAPLRLPVAEAAATLFPFSHIAGAAILASRTAIEDACQAPHPAPLPHIGKTRGIAASTPHLPAAPPAVTMPRPQLLPSEGCRDPTDKGT